MPRNACSYDFVRSYGVSRQDHRPTPDQNSLDECDKCLQQHAADADAIVAGSTIHLLASRGAAGADKVAADIQWLRGRWPNMIWTTSPSYGHRDLFTASQRAIMTPATTHGAERVFHQTCGDFVLRGARGA